MCAPLVSYICLDFFKIFEFAVAAKLRAEPFFEIRKKLDDFYFENDDCRCCRQNCNDTYDEKYDVFVTPH